MAILLGQTIALGDSEAHVWEKVYLFDKYTREECAYVKRRASMAADVTNVWLGVHVQHSIKLAAGIVRNIIKLLLMLARSHP